MLFMANAPDLTLIVVEIAHMSIAPEITQNAKRVKMVCPRGKSVSNRIRLFSINLLSVYGECGGTFESCSHDYDVCNDDKKKC